MATEKEQGPEQRQGEGGEESGAERTTKSESSDLKEREYRDEKGEIHHHTRTSKEMKEKE